MTGLAQALTGTGRAGRRGRARSLGLVGAVAALAVVVLLSGAPVFIALCRTRRLVRL